MTKLASSGARLKTNTRELFEVRHKMADRPEIALRPFRDKAKPAAPER
jgi:hypothetical protein